MASLGRKATSHKRQPIHISSPPPDQTNVAPTTEGVPYLVVCILYVLLDYRYHNNKRYLRLTEHLLHREYPAEAGLGRE